ncbi:MAG: gamma-glutamyl-phosphate reductase, partial [Cyanobacteria bacterium J06648_11]
DALAQRRSEILEANEKDLLTAQRQKLAGPLLKRLKLTDEKLNTLEEGIRSVAAMPEPIGPS